MELTDIYDLISPDIQQVQSLIQQQLSCSEPVLNDFVSHIKNLRGKMLRPVLVLLSAHSCLADISDTGTKAKQLTNQHYLAAAITELIHMATLVHDDVLDEAHYRRHRPAVNFLHGNETAVLLGDLLLSHAFELCSQLEDNLHNRIISRTTNQICEGELLQLYYRGDYSITEQCYLKIITQKTACLMAMCCLLGAKLSKADADTCNRLNEFGLNLGLAFQIMDDVTDITGTEQLSGKTLGTDIAQQKITLPFIHFLNKADSKNRDWLLSQLAKRNSRTQTINHKSLLPDKNKNTHSSKGKDNDRNRGKPLPYNEILQRLRETGSLDYARNRAIDYIDLAVQNLQPLRFSPARQALCNMAKKIAN